MITIRIIAGSLKGRIISLPGTSYGNAEITSQKVKEALFSILGNDLAGMSFLDLYGGSGQIGFEAISRGADHVVINEKDSKRFSFIKSITGKLTGERLPGIILHNLSAERSIKLLKSKGSEFDYIYLDPPYIKTRGIVNIYSEILNEIDKYSILKSSGSVIVQHFRKNKSIEAAGNLFLKKTRNYGNTALSIYKNNIVDIS